MNHKLLFVLLFGLSLGSPMPAQSTSDQPVRLLTTGLSAGLSTIGLTDQYLSELPYEGMGLSLDLDSRRPTRHGDGRTIGRWNYTVGLYALENRPGTASMMYFDSRLGYGRQHRFRLSDRLSFLAGGLLTSEFGFKNYSREVNNPVNIDWNAELNLALSLRWRFQVMGLPYRLSLDLNSPVAGILFVPVRGESYYEMLDLGATDDVLHVTSLHNRNALDAGIRLQVPLRRARLDLGLRSLHERHEANGMFFRKDILTYQLGLSFDMGLFGGERNPVPAGSITCE